MLQKMVGVGTAVTVALLLVGVAWAGGDDTAEVEAQGGASAVLSAPGASAETDASLHVAADAGTSTTLDDDVVSTTVDDVTTSTLDDEPDDDGTTSTTVEDDDEDPTPPSGETTYQAAGAGEVTVGFQGGGLVLLDVNAATGWSFEVEKAEAGRIEVVFSQPAIEVEFRIDVEEGRVRTETRTEIGIG